MAIIKGEIAKKRAHMPIRKLMQRVGPTVQKIKPVFLMSPISERSSFHQLGWNSTFWLLMRRARFGQRMHSVS
jgi:hypothetical protein